MGPTRRAAALGAAACLIAGGAAVTVAVVAGPVPAWTGYVSEAGAGPGAHASAYRMGVLSVAVGLALLAAVVLATSRMAAGLLAGAAAGAALSGSVTCSAGCPLPPFDAATTADLVHGGASIVAVAACVLAMPAVARAAPRLRRGSLVAAGVALPLSATVGVSMLVLGRGAVVGLVERALLVTIALWLVGLAVTLRCRPARHAPAEPPVRPRR
ncbi:DUF998 domain-containing protein [Actinomycetes bacterium KLBMP 9797]